MDNNKFAILATDACCFTLIDNDLHVLLVEAKSPTFKGMWALPGGLVRPTERIQEAIKRYITNIKLTNNCFMEQLFTFDDPKRDPTGRVISVAYLVLVPPQNQEILDNKAFKKARWVDVTKPGILAYDHNQILTTAIERLKIKLEYSNIIYSLMAQEFTLTSLQKAYESILGRKLDKRNFRKKMSSLKLLKSLGKTKKGMAFRPPVLYKFPTKKYQEINIL